MMEGEFEKYDELMRKGESGESACLIAISNGESFAFQIRMLRAVFKIDIGDARDIAAAAIMND